MRIRVLAFAVLREHLGFAERTMEVAEGATVALAARQAFGAPAPKGVSFAVNQTWVRDDHALAEGDELALLPPVSGGAPLLRIQAEPIDPSELIEAVRDASCGAVLTFLGSAREVAGEKLVHLEYEAYADLAERFFARLGEELRDRFGVDRLALVHRTGCLAAGEISIGIALATPHRAAGFDALRHAIERVKEQAPVWKKEVTERGGRWVASEKLEGG
jgi:molybdopterin synthase catalytic subunit